MSIAAAIAAARRLQSYIESHPLDYQRWTVPQVDYLKSAAPRKLLRTGNRVGKSYVAIADMVYRAEKKHPYRPKWNARPGPQHQWLVTVSWSQSIPLQRILRSMLPAGVKTPTWDPAKGWGKDAPTLIFPNGSTIGIRTMRQGPLAHAGAELDHVLLDEPCAAEHYRELERRVVSRAGEVSMAMTPINAPGDLTWLRDMCHEGLIQDLHYPMTAESFQYADTGEPRILLDGTPCDDDWINEQLRSVLPQYREIVIHGGWDEIVTDGVFAESFSRAKHVSDRKPTGTVRLSLGIDHGTKEFTETAVLIAVDEAQEYPVVYVLDTYEAPGNTTQEEDARGILAMLKRNGLQWRDLDHATGDIAHYGGRGRIQRKTNKELAQEIGRELRLGRTAPLSPQIQTAKSGAGSNPRQSVYRGNAWLHRALLRPFQVQIDPQCESIVKSLENYRGGSADPAGHLIDALRYALSPWIRHGQRRRVPGAAGIRVA